MADDDPKFEFGIKPDGSFELDGTTFDAPTTAELADAPVEAVPEEAVPVNLEMQRLREKAEMFDAYEPMLRGIGSGKLILAEAAPAGLVIPEPEDVVSYHRNLSQPGSDVILSQVRAWADALPEEQKAVIDSDYREFNRAYERFAEANKAQPRAGERGTGEGVH
jgi:hypothetical protein